MKQGKILNASFAASALALAGCMVGPDYVEPSFKIAEEELMKEHFSRDESLWKSALPADSLPKGDWWKVFDDPQLDALLKMCRENSPSLKAAFWRVEQAARDRPYGPERLVSAAERQRVVFAQGVVQKHARIVCGHLRQLGNGVWRDVGSLTCSGAYAA